MTQQTQRTAQAPAASPLSGIIGNFSDPAAIGAALERAAKVANIVGPITVGAVPVGCEVVIAAVRLNGDAKGSDVHDVGMGKFGLLRPAVDKIANAAGVVTVETRCIAFSRDYCEWIATRQMRGLDGSPVRATCSRVIDLRPGSAYRKSLEAKAKAKGRDPMSQVNEILAMLGAHAETKARLRADRGLLGIRTYTPEELQRPFIVAKLMFTGKTDDPALKQMFAMGTMQAMLGGSLAMWGAPQPPPFAMMGAAGPSMPQFGAPPPMAALPQGGDIVDVDDDDADSVDSAAAPVAIDWKTIKAATNFEVKFGKDKGKRFNDLDSRGVEWWRKKLEADKDNPDQEKYRGLILSQLKAVYERLRSEGEVTPLDAPATPPAGNTPPSNRGAAAAAEAPDFGGDAADPDNDGR